MAEQDPQEIGCPCDRIAFPPKPDIVAGLSALPRQLAGFPEYRLALLGEIRTHELFDDALSIPLADWRAREGDDLGVMLLEMWAYVLDVLGFYDERIANESYLRTAVRPETLLRLVELIGYHPRPPLAASVTLALLAEEGNGPVAVPRGVAFRSGPFGDEPPQVFETGLPGTIDPRRNEWTLAPIRDSLPGDTWYASVDNLNADEGEFVLLSWNRSVEAGDEIPIVLEAGAESTLLSVDQEPFIGFGASTYVWTAPTTAQFGRSTRIASRETSAALDGSNYFRLEFDPPISSPGSIGLEELSFERPVLKTRVHSATTHDELTILLLDSVQSEIGVDDLVLVTLGKDSFPLRVVDVTHQMEIKLEAPPGSSEEVQPFLLASELTLFPVLPERWINNEKRLEVHFRFVDAGRLTRPAKHRLSLSDLASKAEFEGISEPLGPDARPDEMLLLGEDGLGAKLAATASVDNDGAGRIEPEDDATDFPAPLRTPVRVFGNLIETTRGESVVNEMLGTGDSSRAFQKFTLGKSPLTYLADPSAPDGRRSTLEIRVNGLLWSEVPSFFGVGSDEEVYTVRRDPESGESIVTFGNGEMGARLPTGVQIVASYRYGAGAAAPPANSITQLARPVPGILGLENPVAAGGGADGDSPKDLRRNAPDSALLLGRAVSLQDFEALAREFGVVNAHADWTWDGTTQRAVVKIWFIPNSDAIAEENESELKTTLLGQADPNTPLRACQAQAIQARLVVDLVVDSRHNSDDVELAAVEALTNSETGLLALENIPIGGPLFRSALFEQILSVDGVDSVRAMTLNGKPFGATRTPKEGRYYNFLPLLKVGRTSAVP